MGYSNKDSKILWESYLLNEVNWEKDFPDVQKSCYTPEEVANALNAELERLKAKGDDREKRDVQFPIITKKTIEKSINKETNKIDIEAFKKQIMAFPEDIFSVGKKSENTVDDNIATVNTGIPALRAVLYDEKTNKFFVINTCPGAGNCILNCYAREGFYIMNDGKNLKLIRRLQLMMNHPEKYVAIAYGELLGFAGKNNALDKKLMIRWNDAGDFFSEKYIQIAIDVTKKLLDKGMDVESYAYTKTADMYKKGLEAGMVMNFSTGASHSEFLKMDMKNTKVSVVYPENLFKKTIFKTKDNGRHYDKPIGEKPIFKSEQSKQQLKQNIVDYYNNIESSQLNWIKGILTLENLKYTDELQQLPYNDNKVKYHAIVLPDVDSDRPSQRKDVGITVLLEH